MSKNKKSPYIELWKILKALNIIAEKRQNLRKVSVIVFCDSYKALKTSEYIFSIKDTNNTSKGAQHA